MFFLFYLLLICFVNPFPDSSRCSLPVPYDPSVSFNIFPSLSLSITSHYPFFVSPRLSLCLSQLPVSLILNPVEIGQAEWASFDQALISGVLTVSAHPDPTEPWSPGGELQTGVHPLTLLERKGKARLQSSCLNCQLHTLSSASLFLNSANLTPFIWDGTFCFWICFPHELNLLWEKEISSQCNAIWGWEQRTARRCESHFCFCQPRPWRRAWNLCHWCVWYCDPRPGDDTCPSARHVTKHLAILWHECIMQEN